MAVATSDASRKTVASPRNTAKCRFSDRNSPWSVRELTLLHPNLSFIAGEFGFFDRADDYATFLHAVDKAGGRLNRPPALTRPRER